MLFPTVQFPPLKNERLHAALLAFFRPRPPALPAFVAISFRRFALNLSARALPPIEASSVCSIWIWYAISIELARKLLTFPASYEKLQDMETTPTPEQKIETSIRLHQAEAALCLTFAEKIPGERKHWLARARFCDTQARNEGLFLAGRRMLQQNPNAPEAA